MKLAIEKSHYRKIKPTWRASSIAFGGFGIYVLLTGIENIQNDKLFLGYSGLIAGLIGIYNLVSAIYGRGFLKSADIFRINDSTLEFNDSGNKLREIKIQSLKDIIISKTGLKIQFVTKDLKVIEFDIFQFSDIERKQIIETLIEEKRLLTKVALAQASQNDKSRST